MRHCPAGALVLPPVGQRFFVKGGDYMKCQRCKIHYAMNSRVLLGGLRVMCCMHCLNDWQSFMHSHRIASKFTDLFARQMVAERNAALCVADAAALTADEEALRAECFAISEEWIKTAPIRALEHTPDEV